MKSLGFRRAVLVSALGAVGTLILWLIACGAYAYDHWYEVWDQRGNDRWVRDWDWPGRFVFFNDPEIGSIYLWDDPNFGAKGFILKKENIFPRPRRGFFCQHCGFSLGNPSGSLDLVLPGVNYGCFTSVNYTCSTSAVDSNPEWLVTVSPAYPLILFSILPALWWIRRRREKRASAGLAIKV